MSYHPNYKARRAADIVDGTDPVMFAAAEAIRHIAAAVAPPTSSISVTPLTKESDKNSSMIITNNNNKKRKSKSNESGANANEEVQRAISLVAPQLSSAITSTAAIAGRHSSSSSSRQGPARRPRQSSSSITESSTSSPAACYDLLISACRSKDAVPNRELNRGTGLPEKGGVLLTASELTRLQSSVTLHHTTAARTETHSLYDKMMERLALQRVHFVNSVSQPAAKK